MALLSLLGYIITQCLRTSPSVLKELIMDGKAVLKESGPDFIAPTSNVAKQGGDLQRGE